MLKVSFKVIVFSLFLAFSITSCSRKKDNFISRNYHALTARDNALFNGYNALTEGQLALNDAYNDNYWEILPIERMEVTDEIILASESKNTNFTRAEEKSVMAIQKHGMDIDGRERNYQIDEAYLLLGQARYFDQRFVPALEAFNYILYKYPTSNKINRAKIWREKTNIRLENDELAIKNLKRLLEQEELEKQDLSDATSMLAQAYINTKSLDSALTQIKIASVNTKDRDEKGRFLFIKGQLYNALNQSDSATIAFNEIIKLNRRIPRRYLIGAEIEKAKKFDFENGNALEYLEHLEKLEDNRENRPFLDKITHQIAAYYLEKENDSLATAYFNKSLRTNSTDKLLVSKNYEALAEMNFDKTLYKEAGAYYDSTMLNQKVDSKPYRIIKRKRENLEDVIKYEGIAKINDSILQLVALSPEERNTIFNTHIEKLKQKDKEEKERLEAFVLKNGLQTSVDNNVVNTTPTSTNSNASAFYFYNDATKAYGKNEFSKIWGSRENKDNWRWSSKGNSLGTNSDIGGTTLDLVSNEELYDLDYYISKIPTQEKEIDSLKKDRNFAYYQLGLIYKEKFKEYGLSKTKFTELLNLNPEEKLILPSKYNLYKIYDLLGEDGEANVLKDDITSNYKDSRYAAILNNPELAATKDNNSPESLYKTTFALFNDQKFEDVISNCDTYITQFDGEHIVPKFELLKANAIGRYTGFEPFKEALNHVAVTYANTPEGAKAKEIIDNALPALEKTDFIRNEESGNFKVLYTFKNGENPTTFKNTLDEVIANAKAFYLNTSIDVYDANTKFVVIHGLSSINNAKGILQLFEKEDRYKITRQAIAIASKNYQTIQVHKSLENYLNQ